MVVLASLSEGWPDKLVYSLLTSAQLNKATLITVLAFNKKGKGCAVHRILDVKPCTISLHQIHDRAI